MSTIEITGLRRSYGSTTALDDVDLVIDEGTICGLLGRNGAGKTTLMSLIAGQERPSSGSVRVFDADPVDNAATLARTSFIRDDQRYPDGFSLRHVLAVAPSFHRRWSAPLARSLADAFGIPEKTQIKKMSRGQKSAIAITIGLASRSELTVFDEPYLGLDATARQVFYDRLIADYSEHPRTIVVSTHLIDEMEPLLERVVVLDHGRVRLDTDVDEARASAYSVAGTTAAVDGFTLGRRVLSSHGIGGLKTVTLDGRVDAGVRAEAAKAGVELSRVSLQQVVAALGADGAPASASPPPERGESDSLSTPTSGARS